MGFLDQDDDEWHELALFLVGGHVEWFKIQEGMECPDHKLCLPELLAAYQTVVKKHLRELISCKRESEREQRFVVVSEMGQELRPKLKQRPGK